MRQNGNELPSMPLLAETDVAVAEKHGRRAAA
jgi:hypothetical protein